MRVQLLPVVLSFSIVMPSSVWRPTAPQKVGTVAVIGACLDAAQLWRPGQAPHVVETIHHCIMLGSLQHWLIGQGIISSWIKLAWQFAGESVRTQQATLLMTSTINNQLHQQTGKQIKNML